ncbi:MAG: hypothetical protein DPW18_16970 [Chloroflexi bacterium]|nr:hypothetical protein [Chloroflexota bacterium]MDL1940717.1 hypothetical protein [Chloroflexi bacterium CFX2]
MSIRSANDRLIVFAGGRVRFSCDHARILEAVETHFKHCLGENGPVIADYKITAVDEIRFSISVNGSDAISKIAYEQAMQFLMQDGITRLNGESNTHLVFHAAALAYQGQGVILCGKSGSGKSTLAAWLTADGMQYLTDEVISLPLESEEIGGFCRSVILKKNSAFIWQRLLTNGNAKDILHFEDGGAWIPPALLNASAVRANVAPRILLFPQYVPGAQFHTQKLTPADALFRLLQTLVNARNFADGGMTAAARLARQSAAYTLTYSDIESAARWITQTASTQ